LHPRRLRRKISPVLHECFHNSNNINIGVTGRFKMPAFSCCFGLFILGFILGWILNWLLSRLCCKKQVVHTHTPYTPQANSIVSPVAPSPIITPEPDVSTVEKSVAKTYAFDFSAAKAAGFGIKKANDLTVIEGIGPKINELLNNDGINTFAQLAETPVAAIQHVLDKAGPRFALAKPGTWPQQALLAAENRWAELKTLQDNLKGGV
jgi:predicted flap endonuclease-1-like 5' DNA nuclease